MRSPWGCAWRTSLCRTSRDRVHRGARTAGLQGAGRHVPAVDQSGEHSARAAGLTRCMEVGVRGVNDRRHARLVRARRRRRSVDPCCTASTTACCVKCFERALPVYWGRRPAHRAAHTAGAACPDWDAERRLTCEAWQAAWIRGTREVAGKDALAGCDAAQDRRPLGLPGPQGRRQARRQVPLDRAAVSGLLRAGLAAPEKAEPMGATQVMRS